MPKYSDKKVTAALRKVVAGNEDKVYEPKKNTAHKKAITNGYSYEDCIVGCVIRELDPDVHAEMLAWERGNMASFPFNRSTVTALYGLISGEAASALRVAQAKQDNGAPWGEAEKEYQYRMKGARA